MMQIDIYLTRAGGHNGRNVVLNIKIEDKSTNLNSVNTDNYSSEKFKQNFILFILIYLRTKESLVILNNFSRPGYFPFLPG